ncbi:GntR family transcriptional regulator [Anaerosporobacter faecicola]|uniref:GntR family transcriptional regulator n=1 Tax=Anaerosporobacter faecicola TaxID=2718714 RepID=UPI00143C2604|nr:GntR family transcriptional regulator [Anaerosporobacter faecicola]
MIVIDYKDRRPIYEQVVERFQELILNGALPPDSKLPSVRNLAIELSINPNTIQRAYGTLEQKGYIYSVKGKGSFIAGDVELMEFKKNEVLKQLEEAVSKAKKTGIEYSQIEKTCQAIYKEEQIDD